MEFDQMGPGQLEVHGKWPELRGQHCDACIAEEYWFEGTLEVPANVVWLRAGATWHRLVIDCGIVFWSTRVAGPEAYEMPELRAEVRLRDLGRELAMAGETIEEIAGAPASGGVDVWIVFRSGRRVTFRDRDDHTTWLVC
ncbi:MAG: hypothetical protein R3F29_08530 [Planctomycetota bacterium]